jgi:hypothetical protein
MPDLDREKAVGKISKGGDKDNFWKFFHNIKRSFFIYKIYFVN